MALAASCLLGSSAFASGGMLDDAAQPMLFENYSVQSGLSQSNVLEIHQDAFGMMWFGTENGLNRFDGYRFEHFKRERGNDSALHNDFIFDIAESADGTLWIATNGGGVSRFDRDTKEFSTWLADGRADSLSSNNVRRLTVDAEGFVWAITLEGGLDRLDPQTGAVSKVATGLSNATGKQSLYGLSLDATNGLWVGGDSGLVRIDLGTGDKQVWQTEQAKLSGLPGASVRDILQDSYGTIWVATYGGGLARLKDDHSAFVTIKHAVDEPRSLSGDRVTSLYEDTARRLWVGTTSGLNLLDRRTNEFTRFNNDATNNFSLSDDRVTKIFQDRSGLLWVGTQSHGVNTWNPRTWGFGYEPAKQLSAAADKSPNVSAFTVDDDGSLWLGTFGDGLHRIRRETAEIVHYRNDEGATYQIADSRIMSLLTGREGDVWVGTMTQGLIRLNTKTGDMTQFLHDKADANSLSANGIVTLMQDSAGRVWVGTYGGGVSRLNTETGLFTRFQHDPNVDTSISSNRIMAFAEDPSGKVWIGTEGGGLNLLDPVTGVFHRFNHDALDPSSIASDTIYTIKVASNGRVWVGHRSGGVDEVTGDFRQPASVSFNNLTEKDGLANDVVYGIQEDRSGWLWLSTNYGISKYDPESGEFRNMTRYDGLQSNEFNFGAHYQSAHGELFFGGHNGFNAFDPSTIKSNSVAPLIALTGFFNGNDSLRSDLPVDEDGVVSVDWREKDIAFEFAALDFTNPERNQYQYKLEGRDDQWVNLGSNRRVTYTDLNDGVYQLRVRASNSDGAWNESGLTIPVRVTPAPWDTWWAYLIYAAVALSAVVSAFNVHRRRIGREARYSRRLEQEVQQRTERLVESNAELESLNIALQESSLSDPLTGLRNRRFVFEEISRDIEAIQRKYNEREVTGFTPDASELVFMMIDLDNFKPINDTYGHAAGDAMLLAIKDLLLDICRRSDSVVRWGGDEFVIIAKQTRPEESEALAERIRSAIESHQFELGDGVVARTTCSIGFVAYPLFHRQAEASSLDHMICVADGLMYEAKRQRNAWVGMLTPDSAVTSDNFNHEAIEATSLLFRARRAQNIDCSDRAVRDTATTSRVRSISTKGAS
ncbi:MAG: two-component regulator propeller domain-containing protein [Woeseiaceae bacterium]